jgi:hypothetical protein
MDTDEVQDPSLGGLNFSLKQRGSLSIWFDLQIVWEAEAFGRRGRQQGSVANFRDLSFVG